MYYCANRDTITTSRLHSSRTLLIALDASHKTLTYPRPFERSEAKRNEVENHLLSQPTHQTQYAPPVSSSAVKRSETKSRTTF